MLDIFRTLSLFPELFTYQLAGVALLRIFLGTTFIYFGYMKLVHEHTHYRRLFAAFHTKAAPVVHPLIGILELVGGIMLVVGLYVQGVALFFALLLLGTADLKLRHPKVLPNNTITYLALFVICIALLFLGPGVFAIDFPL